MSPKPLLPALIVQEANIELGPPAASNSDCWYQMPPDGGGNARPGTRSRSEFHAPDCPAGPANVEVVGPAPELGSSPTSTLTWFWLRGMPCDFFCGFWSLTVWLPCSLTQSSASLCETSEPASAPSAAGLFQHAMKSSTKYELPSLPSARTHAFEASFSSVAVIVTPVLPASFALISSARLPLLQASIVMQMFCAVSAASAHASSCAVYQRSLNLILFVVPC